ncbi:MAG: hypothetical protein SAL07_21955, partial [Oscillatoria sp. PMC 1051.18]|nr:hypothetical protein [Oscillatoria sp. PMC 1050.18]MEC5032574.1 hypothetical protein [Oscillatoria sp. PMC 1051.18]
LSNNNFGFHYQPPAWFKDSELGYEALEEEIDPQRLKQKIDDWNKKGLLDMSPTTSNLVNVMRQLGWRLEPGKWVKDV